jgi:branched-chain amino acid transport system substrate-binding protein
MLAIVIGLGCTPSQPILIGFIGGTSGRVADLGIIGRDAVQLAIEQRNAAGGVRGRRLQLVIRDDEQDPDRARRAADELIEQGVVAIIGPMTSAMGVVVAPIATKAGVLVVSPTATTEALSGQDDQFFRVVSTAHEFAGLSARHQLEKGGMRRVAAVYDLRNRAWSEYWLEGFRETFTQGGGELAEVFAFESSPHVHFLDLARELLAVGPDGVLIIANSMDSALLCQQLRKLDPDIAITLADWGATERLLELGGSAVEGVTVVQTFDRDSDAPRYQAFLDAYVKRFGRQPGFAGVYAYEATEVVIDALERRTGDRSLKDILLTMGQIEGLQTPFRFDAFGDVTRTAGSISVIRDGQYVVVD